ncbi:hypothetical protein ACTFIV_004286 [Dictyostelium citrinum]
MAVDNNLVNNNCNNSATIDNNNVNNYDNNKIIKININEEEEVLTLKYSNGLLDKNVPKEISNLINPNRYSEYINKLNKLTHPILITIIILLSYIFGLSIFPMEYLIELETKKLNEELLINRIPIKFNIIYCTNPGNRFVMSVEITYKITNNSELNKISLEV